MTWIQFPRSGAMQSAPDPTDPRGVEQRLRAGTATQADLACAATVMAAYRDLIAMPQHQRNRTIMRMKEATGERELPSEH